ncbi:cytochrome c peroxidase [Aliamphritea spongicola]
MDIGITAASCWDQLRPRAGICRPVSGQDHAGNATGEKLFFEPLLSENRKTSCASCHLFSHGGSYPQAKTPCTTAIKAVITLLLFSICRKTIRWAGKAS